MYHDQVSVLLICQTVPLLTCMVYCGLPVPARLNPAKSSTGPCEDLKLDPAETSG